MCASALRSQFFECFAAALSLVSLSRAARSGKRSRIPLLLRFTEHDGSLSESLSRPLFDSDDLVAETAGKTIPEIFSSEGEEAFRRLEAKAVAALSGKTGAVIATGGGAVLNPENIRYLKKNGRIYFIDRPVESLVPTGDRPTASSREAIMKRYAERYPLYNKYCDVRTDASGSALEVLEAVKEDFLNEDFSY